MHVRRWNQLVHGDMEVLLKPLRTYKNFSNKSLFSFFLQHVVNLIDQFLEVLTGH